MLVQYAITTFTDGACEPHTSNITGADPGFLKSGRQSNIRPNFIENCRKMKKLNRGCASLVPPLDPPMHTLKDGQTQNTKVYYLEIRFYFDDSLSYFPMPGKKCHSGNTRHIPLSISMTMVNSN